MEPTPVDGMKFEAALAELESLVARMEDGQLDLDDSIAAYRRGMVLMRHCQGQLANAETQIRILEEGEARDVEKSSLEAR